MVVLFKKLHRAKEVPVDEEDARSSEEVRFNEGEELEVRLQKAMRKEKRLRRLKSVLYYALLLIVSLGSMKALLSSSSEPPYTLAANDYAFVDTYLSNYFQYPQDESLAAYLQGYSLDSSWKAEYALGDVQTAEVNDTEIYHVEKNDTGFDYYAQMKVHVQTTEEAQDLMLNVKVSVAQAEGTYLVTSPVTMNYTQTQEMSDEAKASFQVSYPTEGTECSEQEKQELQTTIQLFLTTYASDFSQARLLMDDPADLDPLDPNTTITIESFGSIREKDEEYIVDAEVLLSNSQLIQQRQTIRFRVDQRTNKILEMEEY